MRFISGVIMSACLMSGAQLVAADTLTNPPLLRDGSASEHFELVFLSDSYLADVSYSPEGSFFLAQAKQVKTFDSSGQLRFTLEWSEDMDRIPMTHYFVTSEGIYDLSEAEPKLNVFAASLNDDTTRTLKVESWRRVFTELYEKSDVVVYGRRPSFELGLFPAYMRIEGRWLVIYTSPDIDVKNDFDLGSRIAAFPPKFDRMVYLKDPETGNLAADNRRLRETSDMLPEDSLTYRRPGRLEWVSLNANRVLDSSYYLSIPLAYTGPAVHELTLQGEVLRFREYGVKPVLGARESNLNWFALPESLANRSQVSFIEFVPNTNISSQGSDGIYILRPR